METTATEFRELAADCRARARAATNPTRDRQLRECARTFMRQALRLELFEHSKQVGRSQVTQGSFRKHLRAQRA